MFETAFGQKPDGLYQSLVLSSIGRINLGCFSQTGSAIGEHVRIISRQKMGNVQGFEKKRDKNVQLPEKQICETKFHTNTRNPGQRMLQKKHTSQIFPSMLSFRFLPNSQLKMLGMSGACAKSGSKQSLAATSYPSICGKANLECSWQTNILPECKYWRRIIST